MEDGGGRREEGGGRREELPETSLTLDGCLHTHAQRQRGQRGWAVWQRGLHMYRGGRLGRPLQKVDFPTYQLVW